MPEDVLSPEQYFRSNNLVGKSNLARKSVYWLSPNEYLAMSLPLRPGGDMHGSMLGDVKRRMRAVEMSPGNERQKFFDIPMLSITDDGQVIHHNGRHRARAFRDAGLEKIPVALHRYGGGTFENAPPRLVSETGIFTMQAPWQAGPTEDGFPIPRPEYSSPTSRSPEPPRPTPFGQSLIEEYGAVSPQQSIEDYRENPDTNPLRDQELQELEQRKKTLSARQAELDAEGIRLFGGKPDVLENMGEQWYWKTPEEEAAILSGELGEEWKALRERQGILADEEMYSEIDERSIDRRFHDAREEEILSRWGEGTDPNNPYSSRSSGRAAYALVEARDAEDALRGATPGTPEHRQAASRLALAKQKANEIIGLPEAPRGAAVAEDIPEDLVARRQRIADQIGGAVAETYERKAPTRNPIKQVLRRLNRRSLENKIPGVVRPGHSYYLHTVRTGSPEQAASVMQSIDEHGLFYRHYGRGESQNVRPFLLGPLGADDEALALDRMAIREGAPRGGTVQGRGTEYMTRADPSVRTYIIELPDDVTHVDQVGERITPDHPLYETVAEARETRSPGRTGDRPLLAETDPASGRRSGKVNVNRQPWTGRLPAEYIIGHVESGRLSLKPQISEAVQEARATGVPRGAPMPDTPGAAGVFERQRRKAAEATEAAPELTPEMKARQEQIRDLEREIYEQERRLSDLNPDTPSGRQARSRIARAKVLLGRLGQLAGIAGTAYEGGRLAGEIGRHGPIEGTVRYGGTVAEETGDLLSLPQVASEGNPFLSHNPAIALPARALGAAGRGLQRGGRLLRGEDPDPTQGMGLDPDAEGIEPYDLGLPEGPERQLSPEQREELRRAYERAEPMPNVNELLGRPQADIRDVPGELRRNAARRALLGSREREEENL